MFYVLDMKTETRNQGPWYKEIFNSIELTDSRPALRPYLDVDKHPAWVTNVLGELVGQNMPTFPLKKVKEITPKMVGTFLGQNCANVYAVAENLHVARESTNKLREAAKQLQMHEAKFDVRNVMLIVRVMELVIEDSPKSGERFKILPLKVSKRHWRNQSTKRQQSFLEDLQRGSQLKDLPQAERHAVLQPRQFT